jgi:hypothetical protein
VVDAQAVRERREDLERLAGDALLLRGGIAASVRMLCSRSASLTRMMRTSPTIASSIWRRFSACSSS